MTYIFNLLTLVWVFSNLITSLLRYWLVGERFEWIDFLKTTIGTYVLIWVCVGVAYLINIIIPC